ncbi:MAG TPA: hypothetical protein VJ922_05285 [Actinomycetota bacterium]|nr:hypothetical protein [Actinomycetota bacterium]
MSDGVDPHVAGCATCSEGLAAFRGLLEQLRALPHPPERLIEAATDFYRRRRNLEALIDRLAGDPSLQAKAKADPARVLREAGLEPVPDLIELLRDPGRGSGDLTRRIAAKNLWF